MRYSEFSSTQPTAPEASDETPLETASSPNFVFQTDDIEGSEMERYIDRQANALMRRVLRSMWKDAFTDIKRIL